MPPRTLGPEAAEREGPFRRRTRQRPAGPGVGTLAMACMCLTAVMAGATQRWKTWVCAPAGRGQEGVKLTSVVACRRS